MPSPFAAACIDSIGSWNDSGWTLVCPAIPEAAEPALPFLTVFAVGRIGVDQRQAEQVARLADRPMSFEKLGAADRGQVDRHQQFRLQPGPWRYAAANCDVGFSPTQIEQTKVGQQTDVELHLLASPAAEPRNEPARCKDRCRRDGERLARLGVGQQFERTADATEQFVHHGCQDLAGRRQIDAARAPLEERDAEMCLELSYVMADGGLRDAELLRRDRQAEMTGGRLECLEGIQMQETSRCHTAL